MTPLLTHSLTAVSLHGKQTSLPGGQITKRSVDTSAQTTQLSCLFFFFSSQAEHDQQLSASPDIRGTTVRPFSPQVTGGGEDNSGNHHFHCHGHLINSDFFFFFLPFRSCRLPAPLLSLQSDKTGHFSI